jgi:hypothetical protein
VTVRRALLDGLARDADAFELVSELAPLHPRDNTFPGEVFLRVAADALNWCRASRADPLPLEGLRERFLPECTFRTGARRAVFVQQADLSTIAEVVNARICCERDVNLCVAGVAGCAGRSRRTRRCGRPGRLAVPGPGVREPAVAA